MTNRQEVAKKLRKVSTARTTDEVYVALLNCIGITYDYANLFNRLADLIDPTCKPYITCESLTESLTKYTSECSNCGAIFGDFPTIKQAKITHPVYCPNCGARVVRDD